MDKITLPPEANALAGPLTAQGGAYAVFGAFYRNALCLMQAQADMTRSSLDEATGAYAELLGCKSPQEVSSALSRHAARYQERVASILMTMQRDMQGIARDQQPLTVEGGGAMPVTTSREPWPLAWMQSVFGSGNPYAQGMKLMQETAQGMQARMGLPTGEKAGQMNPPGVTQNPKP